MSPVFRRIVNKSDVNMAIGKRRKPTPTNTVVRRGTAG